MSDIVEQFKVDMKREALKFLIQKNIFCPYSNNVLDIDNSIMVDAYNEGELISTHAIHGQYVDKVEQIKSAALSKGLEVDIFVSVKG